MKKRELRAENILLPVLLLSIMSVGLLMARNIATGSTDFWFLNWNLFLAWLPLVFAWTFIRLLQNKRIMSWQSIAVLVLWLIFLPNSFYLVTDFVHLEPYQEVSMTFDIVMFMSYALAGLLLGLISVYLVHKRLEKRVDRKKMAIVLGVVFWLCGIAIYIGRVLGWNSWDILANPMGMLIDVVDRLIYPFEHFETYTFALLFFVFLSVVYSSFCYVVELVGDKK